MRLNSNLQLRKIGDRYMIVDAGSGEVNMTNIYSMNETAAMLWNAYQGRTFVAEDFVNTLFEVYDADKNVLMADVNELIESWKTYGLIVE